MTTACSIRVSILREGLLTRGGAEMIPDPQPAGGELFWVDITNPQESDIEALLEERFGFHELATEDSLSPNTQPKYDRFDKYDFFVFRGIALEGDRQIKTIKIAAFLSQSFLFTIHREPCAAIEAVWNRLPQDARILQRGTDFALYSVLDGVVDGQFPIIDSMEERMDQIHEVVFQSPSQQLLDDVLDIKRDLNVLRRSAMPQRELFNAISRGDASFVQQQHLIYFRDLYDHTFRIAESIDNERDLASSTMEAYLSVVANRTNDIMKVLTIISTVLLPMNFIAGLYGMNFVHMPELHWHYGYLYALGVMATLAMAMVLWFVHRGWIGSGEDRRRPHRLRRSATRM